MSVDGFYAVDFSAFTKGARGLVVVEKGQIRGGDDQYLYSGQISESGNALNVVLKAKAYVAGAVDVFGKPSHMIDLVLTGTMIGHDIQLVGTHLGQRIDVKATGLSPINF